MRHDGSHRPALQEPGSRPEVSSQRAWTAGVTQRERWMNTLELVVQPPGH